MFQKLRHKIEVMRKSKKFLWRFLVFGKDSLWQITSGLKLSLTIFSEIFQAKPKNKGRYIYLRLKNYRFLMWEMLHIELHSFCNRDCAWCPRYYDRSGIRKDSNGDKVRKRMSTEKVYNLIDQASKLGYKGAVAFHRLSEPLIDPRYVEVWKYARGKGMKLHAPTNGDVLRRNPELCSELDGFGNSLVIGLYDCETDEEAQREMDFWREKFKKSEVSFSEPLRQKFHVRQNAQVYDLARKDVEEVNRPCLEGKNGLLIRYDGNVCFCCQDDQCTFSLGNVFEQSIEEIWWSNKHIQILRTLEKTGGRRRFSLCSGCYALPSIEDKSELFFIRDWVKQQG